MMPTANIVTMVIVAAVSFVLPVIGCIIVWRRTRASVVNALIGMVVFFVCYVIAVTTSLLGSMVIASPIVLTLVLSLRAGLVEEFGRFVAFKWMLKRRRDIGDALMYGVGHGGIEVWLVFTLSMVGSLALAFMYSSGAMDLLLASDPEQAAAIGATMSALAQASPLDLSAGLFERVVAMLLHIALSVIVFCAVRQKKWLYLLLAIVLHALVDSSTALYVTGLVNTWMIELILALATAFVALIAWRIARGYRQPEPLLEPEGKTL